MRLSRGCATAAVTALTLVACGFPRPIGGDDGADAPAASTYQLLSIEPAIATTGETLVLEGTFAETATVQFPGGAVQSATVLGDHRATVVVPAAATAGDLTVSTGGTTVGPV